MKNATLGAGTRHVYISRAATLNYMQLLRHMIDGYEDTAFERARRSLMVRALLAVPDPDRMGVYLMPAPDGPEKMELHVVVDESLLVVRKVKLATSSLPESTRHHYTSGPVDRR